MGSKIILKFKGEKKPRPEANKFKGSINISWKVGSILGSIHYYSALVLHLFPYLLIVCANKKTRQFWACCYMTILTCLLEIITQTHTFREVKRKTYHWSLNLHKVTQNSVKKISPLPNRCRGVGVPGTYLIKYFSYFKYDIICSMPTGRREHFTTSHHICSLSKVSNLISFVGLSVTILIPLAPNTSFTIGRCTVNPKWKWEQPANGRHISFFPSFFNFQSKDKFIAFSLRYNW